MYGVIADDKPRHLLMLTHHITFLNECQDIPHRHDMIGEHGGGEHPKETVPVAIAGALR